MKVFISWSGERSKRVAELLDNWFQCVIQAVKPWMSSKDIDRGALWFTEISDQLANTSIGVVCLTKENRNKPWILFESGALAKGLTSNRVCTFLIDLQPTDLENPLAQFNHTFPTKDGVWSLVRTINSSLKESILKESVLEKVFDTYWPQFERDFAEAISATSGTEVPEIRKENEIMLDILSTVRMLEKRLRSIEDVSSQSRKGVDLFSTMSTLERASIHKEIVNLFDSGVSTDNIIELISRRGFVPEYIAAIIENHKTTVYG
jgi:hypothetical protein